MLNNDVAGFLDSIRGFSAFIVLLAHVNQFFILPCYVGANSLAQIIPGYFASCVVTAFLVVSSFVISHSVPHCMQERDKGWFAKYMLRRCARIYPPLMFSLLLALVVCSIIHRYAFQFLLLVFSICLILHFKIWSFPICKSFKLIASYIHTLHVIHFPLLLISFSLLHLFFIQAGFLLKLSILFGAIALVIHIAKFFALYIEKPRFYYEKMLNLNKISFMPWLDAKS